jgi:hypothetical protein
MLKDSLVPQQTYDEIFAKYQGAQAHIAVQAELDKAKKGADRATNNGSWPKKSYWRIAGSADQSAISLLPGHEYRNDYLKPGRTRISRIYHLRVT